jgi:GTPase SAR1 family protein
VGDSHIGKTQLIFSYAEDKFLERYIPTVADEYEVQDIYYQGNKVTLSVWDMSAEDEHIELREFAYSKSDAVIFCFTLADAQPPATEEKKVALPQISLGNVRTKWIPEFEKALKSDEPT